MEPRRTPSAAAVAAIAVGVFALAAIPMMLFRHGSATGSAQAADASATTETVPIRMQFVHSDPVDPTSADTTSADSVHLQGPTGPILTMVFNADDTLMAGTDRGGNAHVWTRAGRLIATVTPASGLRIASVAFTATDHQFVTVSSDGSVHFWPLPAAA